MGAGSCDASHNAAHHGVLQGTRLTVSYILPQLSPCASPSSPSQRWLLFEQGVATQMCSAMIGVSGLASKKAPRILCCQGSATSAAGVQASFQEMRSMNVRSEQQIAAGQAELAAAQEHTQLLQEMLHDAQVCQPGLQIYLGCKGIQCLSTQLWHFYGMSIMYCCCDDCTAYDLVTCFESARRLRRQQLSRQSRQSCSRPRQYTAI